jgi:1-aminocyclopropane-1-carboxylate deaminase
LWNEFQSYFIANDMVNLENAVVQTIHLGSTAKPFCIDILRLDAIHPVVSGNKWFKLRYYLQTANEKGCTQLLTFGGAHSNHIVATASAAKEMAMDSIGIIRGEAPTHYSAALTDAQNMGMQLQFVSRDAYAQKESPHFITALQTQNPNALLIPEGGSGPLGIAGAATILQTIDTRPYTHIACAMGTGTMLAGLAINLLPHQQLIGIPVLKGFNQWLATQTIINPQLLHQVHLYYNYHFGGYAKKNERLIHFMNQLYQQTGLPTDFVYTAKLLYAVIDLFEHEILLPSHRLLVVHSGGLQGNRSLPKGLLAY